METPNDDTDGLVPTETRERIDNDPFCALLGVELVDLEPGFAETRLALREEHLNFHGTPHGGAIYALADAAFAAACNAGEARRIALETNVSYLGSASVGQTLVAVAEETHASRRTAEYRVLVRSEDGRIDGTGGSDESGGDDREDDDERIATFRGRAYRV